MSETKASSIWREIKPFAIRDIGDMLDDAKSTGGDFGYFILLYAAGEQKVKNYSVTAAGLSAALSAAGSGDLVYLPPGTYTGNYTVKSGVTLAADDPENTILLGNVTLSSGARLENLTITGAVIVPGGVSGEVKHCHIYNASGAAVQVSSGGTIAIHQSIIQGSTYAISNSGTAKIYHSGVWGGTSWFDGTVYTYCVTEILPVITIPETYGHTWWSLTSNNSRPIGYHMPIQSVFTAPTTPSSYDELVANYTIRGLICKGDYVYFTRYVTSNYELVRYNISDDTEDILFAPAETGWNKLYVYFHFAIMDDGRAITVINNSDDDGDVLRWEIGDFDTGEREILVEIPNQSFYWHWVVTNGKLVTSRYAEGANPGGDPSKTRTFYFKVYDIATGNEEQSATTELALGDATMKYPTCAPIIVGDLVYFEYNMGTDADYEGVDDALHLFEFNIATGDLQDIRPKYNTTQNFYMYAGGYDAHTGNLFFTCEMATSPNTSNKYFVAVVDQEELTFSYELVKTGIGATDPPIAILTGALQSYVVQKDGKVFALDDFVNPVIEMPALVSPANDSGQQQHKMCNLIDSNGYIWRVDASSDLHGYSITGGATIDVDINIPALVGTTPKQYIYLSDGKLFVHNDDSTGTENLYLLE